MSKHQFTDIRVAIEPDNPSIQRLEFKCIKCGNCKTVCTDYIGVCGTYDLKATGVISLSVLTAGSAPMFARQTALPKK